MERDCFIFRVVSLLPQCYSRLCVFHYKILENNTKSNWQASSTLFTSRTRTFLCFSLSMLRYQVHVSGLTNQLFFQNFSLFYNGHLCLDNNNKHGQINYFNPYSTFHNYTCLCGKHQDQTATNMPSGLQSTLSSWLRHSSQEQPWHCYYLALFFLVSKCQLGHLTHYQTT